MRHISTHPRWTSKEWRQSSVAQATSLIVWREYVILDEDEIPRITLLYIAYKFFAGVFYYRLLSYAEKNIETKREHLIWNVFLKPIFWWIQLGFLNDILKNFVIS